MYNKIPLFTDEMEAFIIKKITAGKLLPKVVNALIDRYPEQFSDVEGCDLEEVKKILYGRLRTHKYDRRYTSYWKIKEAQEEVKSVIADIDIADPIQQLRMFDSMDKQMAAAETREEIDKLAKKSQTRQKIMAEARKTVEMILPQGDDTDEIFNHDDIPPIKTKVDQ